MTAILNDIRRLEAAHARGDLSTVELAEAKARLMDAVPDAMADEGAKAQDASEPSDETVPGSTLGSTLLLCAMILVIVVGSALLLTRDVMLTATLGITVLAAFTVMLFRQIDG